MARIDIDAGAPQACTDSRGVSAPRDAGGRPASSGKRACPMVAGAFVNFDVICAALLHPARARGSRWAVPVVQWRIRDLLIIRSRRQSPASEPILRSHGHGPAATAASSPKSVDPNPCLSTRRLVVHRLQPQTQAAPGVCWAVATGQLSTPTSQAKQ